MLIKSQKEYDNAYDNGERVFEIESDFTLITYCYESPDITIGNNSKPIIVVSEWCNPCIQIYGGEPKISAVDKSRLFVFLYNDSKPSIAASDNSRSAIIISDKSEPVILMYDNSKVAVWMHDDGKYIINEHGRNKLERIRL